MKKGELGKAILLLLAAGVLIPAVLIAPNLPLALRALLRSHAKKLKTRPQNLRKALRVLKRKRLVAFREVDGKTQIVLSEAGGKRVLSYKLKEMKLVRPEKWDGFWRIVIFDIPEEERRTRDAFRVKLQELGFYSLQKSCLIYPFPSKDEVDFISEVFGVSPYVNFLTVKALEGEKLFRQHFEL